LLQRRVAYETARAVLAAHGEKGPELSEHTLLAPAHLDILPILAIVARDYAEFAEPEGMKRQRRAPIRLYESPRWAQAFGEVDEATSEMMQTLQHPAWFESPIPLGRALQSWPADICVAACDPDSLRRLLAETDRRFARIVIIESLNVREDKFADTDLPGEVVRLERRIGAEMTRHRERLETPQAREGMWRFMMREQSFDLEPAVPFGLGIEMVIRDLSR
jgi:hypothetical protein